MKGKTVAILENRLGRQLADLVEKHGGRALPAPALAEIPVDTVLGAKPPKLGPLVAALDRALSS